MNKQTCKKCQFENGKHSRACPYFKEPKNPMKQNKNYIDKMLEDYERNFVIPMKCRNSSDEYPNCPATISWDCILGDFEKYLKQKLREVEQNERERIIEIIERLEVNVKEQWVKNQIINNIKDINKIQELK